MKIAGFLIVVTGALLVLLNFLVAPNPIWWINIFTVAVGGYIIGANK